MYTEEEAKEKWCPFVRRTSIDASLLKTRPNAHAPSIPVNRGIEDDFMCIGSRCMAWRWNDDFSEFKTVIGDERIDKFLEADGWSKTGLQSDAGDGRKAEQWLRENPKRKGYCGLAGKPE